MFNLILNGALFYISALCGCLILQFFTGKIQFSGRYKLLEFIYVPFFSTVTALGAVDYFPELDDKTIFCCAGVWVFSAFLIVVLENWNQISLIGLLVKISLTIKATKLLYKGEFDKLENMHEGMTKSERSDDK